MASDSELFAVGAIRAVKLGADAVPELQRFFDDNPEYFFAVDGQAPGPAEAHAKIHDTLPEGWAFTEKWIVGFVDETDSMVAMANVVSNLIATGVWHIGLLVVATRLHGSGVAHTLYESIERWARDSGAQWLRLGVVAGNTRAERFWERHRFIEVRKRSGVEMGCKVNTLRVMAKPLTGGTVQEYLALVARDRPESA